MDVVFNPATMTANTLATIFNMYSYSTGISFQNNTQVNCSMEINGSPYTIATPSVSPNVFKRITMTYDNANAKVYVNGVLTNTFSISGSFTQTDTPFDFYSVGCAGYGAYYYKGIVSTVRVYSRALTATEILTMYTAGKRRYGY
jgi:hypothetical protein